VRKPPQPARRRAPRRVESALEARFAQYRKYFGLPLPVREYRFAPPRRWRFDFAWPEKRVAVEIEGGIFSMGRHTRGQGFLADAEKYNRAAMLGWCVLRYCAPDLDDPLRVCGEVREALDR